jgi:hypothetical protein
MAYGSYSIKKSRRIRKALSANGFPNIRYARGSDSAQRGYLIHALPTGNENGRQSESSEHHPRGNRRISLHVGKRSIQAASSHGTSCDPSLSEDERCRTGYRRRRSASWRRCKSADTGVRVHSDQARRQPVHEDGYHVAEYARGCDRLGERRLSRRDERVQREGRQERETQPQVIYRGTTMRVRRRIKLKMIYWFGYFCGAYLSTEQVGKMMRR